MNGFEKMKLRASVSGNSIREEKINDSRNVLKEDNENDPSYCKTMFIWRAGSVNEKSNQIHPRIYNRKYSTSNGVTQKIQTLYDEKINIGDLFIDEKDNSFWMCSEIYDMDEISWNGLLKECTYILKFQSSDGTILSYPCITTNRIQGTGDKETNVITLPDGRKKVVLSLDENTILLDNERRLYLDTHPTKPRPYIITFVDRTIGNYGDKGYLEIYLQEDQNNHSTDRIDLGICDYKEPTTPIQPPEGDSYALLSIDGSLILGGKSRTITSIFYDADGVEVNDVDTRWNVIIPSGYEKYFVITYSGNLCFIKVGENFDLLDEIVVINVSDGNGCYNGTLNVKIESGW